MDDAEAKRLEAWGFRREHFDEPPLPVWPDNRQTVALFLAMRTQWHVGMSGATGLIYAALPELWRRLKVPPAERDGCFFDLQIMEHAALAAMHDKANA
jgi:hypothetical protein